MLRRHAWWLAPLAGAAVAGAVVAAISLGGGSSSRTTPTTSKSRLRPAAAALAFQDAITAVVHELSPSVVQIQNPQGLGSGVVFDSNGDIVTNNHVVAGGGPFTVTAGSHTYEATLVGHFAPDDLAVVRVSGQHLAAAPFADSSALEVGDIAIAIGNPLGLRSSVTDGIVSAFRQGVSEGNGVALPLMIQTSAPINPGNSGGALADSAARVVGINTAVAGVGLGLAVPIDATSRGILAALIHDGRVARAYLGVVGGTRPLPPRLATQVGRPRALEVVQLLDGSPAALAGVRTGDLILALDDRPIEGVGDLQRVLDGGLIGRRVELRVARDGNLIDLGLTPAELRESV